MKNLTNQREMAKKISAKDIFQSEDIFIGIRESAKQTIKMMQQLKGEVEKTASALSGGLSKSQTLDSTKELEKVVKVSKQANTLKKEAIQIDKLHSQAIQQEAKANQELEKIEQQKLKTQSQQMRNDKQMRTEKERLLKIQEKQKKTITDESNAYKRLVKETREAKNESKRLGAEMLLLEKAGKKNSKEYRNLAQAYNQMTTSAKKGDKALKKLDKSVGDNFRNVGNYKGAIQGLIGTLGTLGAGVGIGQIFRNVTGIMIDFDQAQADLSAISGKTKEELSGLTAQAKELGATTQFSATQISEMQIELAKLGFTTKQIEQSTEAVSNFASATGSDLASASKVAGSSLRMFNLEAYEMERVVSVMGVATTKSALSFADFESSMANVGPVANAFGFSIEDSVTLLAKLKDAGFEASKGSVAVRNILLKLADASSPLAKAIGGPVKSLEDMEVAFKKLEASGVDLNKALELTDKRSVSAFEVFLKQAGTLTEFRDSITDVNHELEEMSRKKLDSVQGQLTLLKSAWEGFILGVDDSTGASAKLKDMIGFLARNLETIMDVIIRLTRVWIAYKVITKTQIAMNRLMASSFMQTSRNMTGLTGVVAKVKGAFSGLGQAIKNNMGGIILVTLMDFAMKMKDINSITKTTERNMNSLTKAQEEVTTNLKKEEAEARALFDALKETNEGSAERVNLIDEINSRYGITLQNLIDEHGLVDGVRIAYDGLIASMRQKASLEGAQIGFQTSQKNLAEMKTQLEEWSQILQPKFWAGASGDTFMKAQPKVMGGNIASKLANGLMASITGGVDYDQIAKSYNAMVDQYGIALSQASKYEDEYVSKMVAFHKAKGTTGVVTPLTTGGGGGGTGTKKVFDTKLKELRDFNSKYFELQQNARKIDEKERQRESKDVISGEIMNAIKRARETGEARVEVVEEMMALELETKKDFFREELELEKLNARENLIQKRKEIWDGLKLERKTKFEALGTGNTKEKKELRKNQIKRLNLLTTQWELENDEFKIYWDNKMGTMSAGFTKMDSELEAEQDDYNNKINDALDTFAEGTSKASKIASDDAIATAKEQADIINGIVSYSADYFIKRSEDKIEQMNKEITEAEKQADHFRTLAENGNIDAKESLAEQQRIINEKNKEKLKQEKIQQRIRLTESVLNTYSAKVTQNPETAISETIRDTTLLLSFINSLPAFHDGTENTGENGQGVDGKGGFHAVLHPNERVIPKSMNDKMGSLTNEDLTKLAIDYKNGRVVEKASYSSTSLDLSVLVGELSEIKQTIKNKPETNIELGEITSTMMEMVKTTKKGNSITYNRYKIRK